MNSAADNARPGRLVLVRHGQSDWNLKNLFTGWTDVDLTERGVDEARDAAARVRELDPAFRLDEFAATQPYRNPHDLERLLERLREAGLGD